MEQTLGQIISLVEEAFVEEIHASVGDHFGSPSAYIEGKEAFLQVLRESRPKRQNISAQFF